MHFCRSSNSDWSIERELLWGTQHANPGQRNQVNTANLDGNNQENILNDLNGVEMNNVNLPNQNVNAPESRNQRYNQLIQERDVLRNIGDGIQIGNAGFN